MKENNQDKPTPLTLSIDVNLDKDCYTYLFLQYMAHILSRVHPRWWGTTDITHPHALS